MDALSFDFLVNALGMDISFKSVWVLARNLGVCVMVNYVDGG